MTFISFSNRYGNSVVEQILTPYYAPILQRQVMDTDPLLALYTIQK